MNYHPIQLTISVNYIIYIHFLKVRFTLETLKLFFQILSSMIQLHGLKSIHSIEHVRYHIFYESNTIIKEF